MIFSRSSEKLPTLFLFKITFSSTFIFLLKDYFDPKTQGHLCYIHIKSVALGTESKM